MFILYTLSNIKCFLGIQIRRKEVNVATSKIAKILRPAKPLNLPSYRDKDKSLTKTFASCIKKKKPADDISEVQPTTKKRKISHNTITSPKFTNNKDEEKVNNSLFTSPPPSRRLKKRKLRKLKDISLDDARKIGRFSFHLFLLLSVL